MTRNPGPLYPMSNIRDTLPAGGGGLGVFDSPDALQINRARMEHLDSLQLPLAGKRVLDAGCGVGHLARYFVDRGCQVTCVDARQDNIDSLRSRYPDVTAHVVNVETDSLLALGQFDIVFCYGLLYHLENPVAALRNFSHVCGGILLLETVITDHREPILQLSDEPAETPNQALGGFAGRPSPAFVAMALTRAGFRYVYAPRHPPEHPDFQFKWQNDLAFSRNGHLLRCIFVASRQLQDNAALSLLVEGPEIESSEAVSRQAANPGLTPGPRTIPSTESELLEAARDLVFVRPLVPYPGWSFGADWDNPDAAFQMRRRIWEYSREHKLEVPFVFEWHAGLRLNLYLGNDLSRQLYIAGCVEPNQFAFLNQILAPGMVFVDGGANDGLYTLFASRRVGREGIVWAFEPSAREFSRLELNLRLNQTENVKLFRVALADRDGEADLAIADDEHAGHNTLGAFAHDGVDLVRTERISVRRLDGLVREAHLPKLDVMKLDVEGAEHRVLEGAREVVSQFRPVLLFEVVDSALQTQGSSREKLLGLLTSLQYKLFAFDSASGRPEPTDSDLVSDNMIAIPAESPFALRYTAQERKKAAAVYGTSPSSAPQGMSPLPAFNPARSYWNQRVTLAEARDRILSLSQAVDQRSDLLPYQWAQLMAAAMEFEPDLILELGRGKGNSTCAFTEASNLKGVRWRVLSLCLSDNWERETVPRLRRIVPESWFAPLNAQRADILNFHYETALSGARRVLLLWDAHGFDIAECVLGEILPILAKIDHLVIMHDLSDTRYSSEEQLRYGEHGLWKGNDWTGRRLKLGIIDSAVEQSVAALDFVTRNHITLDSADHSFRTDLTPGEREEMRNLLGELFDTQGHWFYFSLNERPGPYTFPSYTRVRPRSRNSRG